MLVKARIEHPWFSASFFHRLEWQGRPGGEPKLQSEANPETEAPGEHLDSEENGPQAAFRLSTLLLAESFLMLSAREEESLHFCSGLESGHTSFVQNLLPVTLSESTVISARGEPEEVASCLERLERYGHCLNGIFHIHPGRGRRANLPSSTDREYMARLSGRRVLFGIWSRDGFLRLLTIPEGADIEIFGDGIKEIEDDSEGRLFLLERELSQSLLGLGARPGKVRVRGSAV